MAQSGRICVGGTAVPLVAVPLAAVALALAAKWRDSQTGVEWTPFSSIVSSGWRASSDGCSLVARSDSAGFVASGASHVAVTPRGLEGRHNRQWHSCGSPRWSGLGNTAENPR